MKARIGNLLSLPSAGALLVLFFLPWLDVKCADQEMARASGLDLARGRLQTTQAFEDLPDDRKPGRADEQGPDAQPLAWLGLALPVVVLLVGLGGRSLGARLAGPLLVLLGVAGVALMLWVTTIDYSTELPRELAGKIVTEPRPLLWVVLGLHALIGFAGVTEILSGAAPPGKKRSRKKR